MNKALSILIFLSLTSGCLNNTSQEIDNVTFSIENEEIVRGEVIFFSTNGSDYPSGSSFFWKFGDGSGAGGTSAEHIYSTEGIFEVSLTVVSNNGNTGQYVKEIEVLYPNLPPIASSYILNEAGHVQLGRVNTEFFFYGNDSSDPEGSSLNYSWSFGDGSSSSGMYTNYSYVAAGNYTINLTVTDERNISSSSLSWVVVKNYEYNITFQEMESTVILSSPPNRLLEGETNTTLWMGHSNLTSVRFVLEWTDDIQTLEDLQDLGFSQAAIDAIASIFGVFFPDTFELALNTTEINGINDFSEQSSSEYIEANYENMTGVPNNPGIYQFETETGAWIWLENNFPSNETGHNNWTIDVTCIHASPDDVLGFFFDPDDGNNFTLSVIYTYYVAVLTEVSLV